MGQRLISLKGPTGWRGKSTRSISDLGQRRLLKLENGYVSSDGSEIRSFPGYRTLLDLSPDNNSNGGYARYTIDGVKPVFETTPSDTYQYLSYRETQREYWIESRAKPTHLHWFEQVGDTLVIGGESRFRESPLMSAARVKLTISSITITGGRYVLNMSDTIGTSFSDAITSASLNAITSDSIVYVEGVTLTDPTGNAALNTAIGTNLNSLMHEIFSVSGSALTLKTTTAASGTAVAVSAGDVHKVRPNRSNTYNSSTGVSPYSTTYDDRPDDPDAFTVWRVVDQVEFGDCFKECFPAWVANRTRDWGDGFLPPASPYNLDVEGVFTQSDEQRGASRREQRTLPFRTNPEPAGDRIIVAAPAYGCLLQAPLKVPINPYNWPYTPSPSDGLGIWHFSNDIYDKPRALGIPKARLIDSIWTPAPPSPNIAFPGQAGFNFNAVARSGSPEFGLPAGTYLVSISFEDEALGEEGLASEPIEVTIPDNNYAYSIVINYVHPGYVMPECLATKINVYIAPPNETALAYYGSFPLGGLPLKYPNTNSANYDLSGRYGFIPSSPLYPYATANSYELPVLGNGLDVSIALDAERLAPQSASMPRGAESARYIRGVLVAGGHTGNEGGSLQLWAAYGTLFYADSYHPDPGQMTVLARSITTNAMPGGQTDGTTSDSTLGTAGRRFPDAYQGIEVTSADLFPTGQINQQVDRVVNPKAIDYAGSLTWNHDSLQLTREIFDRIRTAGSSPTTTALARVSRQIWYRMPKGQLQIGDPGAPNRASKAAIQFIDPNRGDDVTAIGQLAGSAIICSRRETYSMSWYRTPGGEVPQLLSNEHGCIGANTMVEFDGGLAWLGEKGPVAMGGTLQYVGIDVQDDFTGLTARYLTDSRGMMRHSWGCHDSVRGLVMWGVVTSDNTTLITRDLGEIAWASATDGEKSRFPCDEVLVWSYRANAFSTWRPPAGLEIYWMRQIRNASGQMVTAFLAADGRIYQLEDDRNDIGGWAGTPSAAGVDSTSVTLTFISPTGTDGRATTGRGSDEVFVEIGDLVEIVDADGNLTGSTTVTALGTFSGNTVTLSIGSQSWDTYSTFYVGGRQRMTIITSFLGAETMDTLSAQAVQMRYTLFGTGRAHAKVTYLKSDIDNSGPTVLAQPGSESDWETLGQALVSTALIDSAYIGQRRRMAQGGVDAPEIAVKIETTGLAQVRISDLALEVG